MEVVPEPADQPKLLDRHDAMQLFDLLEDDQFDVSLIARPARKFGMDQPDGIEPGTRFYRLRVSGHAGDDLTADAIQRVIRIAGDRQITIGMESLVIQ